MRYLHERHTTFGTLAFCLTAMTMWQTAWGTLSHERCHDVATSVRTKYESVLPSLELEKQRHFAVRLYRMTGDTAYVGPVVADFQRAVGELRRDLNEKDDTKYIQRRTDELLSDFSRKTRKGQQRWKLFKRDRTTLFALAILDNTKRISEHRPANAEPDSLLQMGIEYLQGIDWTSILLDEPIIHAYSPQVVNYIYYLHDLGIANLRPQYGDAFRRVFPDDRDVKLSKYEFRDKVYGLTHFILAASDYYQYRVDSTEFAWILAYFASHIDRILIETTSDIMAEVGICFLLCRGNQHPALADARIKFANGLTGTARCSYHHGARMTWRKENTAMFWPICC